MARCGEPLASVRLKTMGLMGDAIKVVDFLAGRPLCLLLGLASRFRKREVREGDPSRILVIRPGGIGDAVLFIPMLQALRRNWPRAEIVLLMERRNSGVIEGTGLADQVLRYDNPVRGLGRALRLRFDLVIDTEQYHCLSAVVAFLTGAPRRIGFGTNWRRGLLTHSVPYDQELYEVFSFLQLAETATGEKHQWDPEIPFYPLPEPALVFARQALIPLGERPLVAIHPGASIPERRWPPTRYGALAAELAQDGAGIVILGGKQDVQAAGVISAALAGKPFVDLAGRCTLQQAAAVVSRVAVYVSADTGLLHLAFATGTSTVHLFGPGVLSKWGPPGNRFRCVEFPTPCSPCTRYGYTPPCCQGTACMLGIPPEQVGEAVRGQLRKKGLLCREAAR